MSNKRRKPTLVLASAIHRITPSTSLPIAASSSTTATKKRKRTSPATLISQFHQLQRQKDELTAQKAKLSTKDYNDKLAAIEANIQALGGLEAYQNLSIAGHSSSKYAQFNSAHWIVDVLAEAGLGLQSLKGKHLSSGATSTSLTTSSTSLTSKTPEEKKLAKRQKERERKRAKKRAKKEEEEKAAAEAEVAAKKTSGKGGKGQQSASNKKAPAKKAESEDEAEDDDDEAASNDDENESEQKDEVEEEGDASSYAPTSSQPAPVFSNANRVKLLDVGAITNHFLPYASLIDCMAIDLNPQHSSVIKKDFFDLDFNKLNGTFDVVVLSLVLNFVGDRFKRGEMIKSSMKLLKTNGYARMFIVLPAACLKNSRWMNHESFVLKCMKPLGLRLGKFKYTTKLALFEFIREEVIKAEPTPSIEPDQDEVAPMDEDDVDNESKSKKPTPPKVPVKPKKKGFQPAGIVLEGETRNNFSIAWKADQE